jgi:hypothetical protein
MQRWKWDVLPFDLITSSPVLDLEQHLVLQNKPHHSQDLSLSLLPSLSLSLKLCNHESYNNNNNNSSLKFCARTTTRSKKTYEINTNANMAFFTYL